MDLTLTAGLLATFMIVFGHRRWVEVTRRRRRFQAHPR